VAGRWARRRRTALSCAERSEESGNFYWRRYDRKDRNGGSRIHWKDEPVGRARSTASDKNKQKPQKSQVWSLNLPCSFTDLYQLQSLLSLNHSLSHSQSIKLINHITVDETISSQLVNISHSPFALRFFQPRTNGDSSNRCLDCLTFSYFLSLPIFFQCSSTRGRSVW